MNIIFQRSNIEKISLSLRRELPFVFCLILGVFILPACSSDDDDPSSPPAFTLSSSAGDDGFDPGSEIPKRFRDYRDSPISLTLPLSERSSGGPGMGSQCSGDNDFPKLTWRNPPAETRSFVLIVDDPDGMDWVHLNLHTIVETRTEIPLTEGGDLLEYGTEGATSWSENGWRGPCPPSGRHNYVFQLYALNEYPLSPALSGATNRSSFESAYDAKILGSAEIRGWVEKP